MATYRCKIHTGPTLVKALKRMFKRAHMKRVVAGTEHLYADVAAISVADAEAKVVAKLRAKHRGDFGYGGSRWASGIRCVRRKAVY